MCLKAASQFFTQDFSADNMATIDIKTAAIILDRAFTEASPANDKTGMLIDKVLHGNHKNGSHAYSIEVKDKDFSAQDVAHAISKFKQAGLTTSLFIYGKKASFDKESVYALLKKAGREGHYCCLISILHYSKLRISEIKSITVHDFVDGMLKFARLINAKEDTVSTVKQIASKIS